MAHLLLHGTLEATILEADHISNPTRATGAAPGIFRKFVEGFEDSLGLGKGATRLYATIDLGRARVGRTRVVDDEPVNPRWYEEFHIYCAHFAADIVFSVKAAQPIGATLIGRAYLPVRDLLSGEPEEDLARADDTRAAAVPRRRRPRRPPRVGEGRRRRTVSRRAVHLLLAAARVQGDAVPGRARARRVRAEDPARRRRALAAGAVLGGRVRCHQQRQAPDIPHRLVGVHRDHARPRRCPAAPPGGDATLGELLKRKASEGVRVLLLVWDDRTSVESLGMKWGFMSTHDAETAEYFRGTDVRCVLCPRNPDADRSAIMARRSPT